LDFNKELKKYISTIHYYAKRMYMESSVCDKDDLVQAGMIGMNDGLEHFSEEKAKLTNTKKSTYVIGCIRNAMLEEANKFYGPLRLPHRKKLRLNTFKKMLVAGCQPDEIKEVMSMGDTEFEDLSKLIMYSGRATLQVPMGLEDRSSDMPDESSFDLFTSKNLTDDEQEILRLRILEDMTFAEIGKVYGVKRETMRKRVLAILNKIKAEIKDE